MKRNMMIGAVVVTALSMVSLSQAATYTWTGANGGDWTDAGNWNGGVPAVYLDSISGRANSVVIDGSLANQPSVSVPAGFDAFVTPEMVLTDGATLSLTGVRGNGGTGHGNGSIADVSGAGSHLTLTPTSGSSWQLSREDNGTEVWNVSDQGTITLTGTGRADMGFNQARLTQVNLDNGTFNLEASNVWGTRGNAGSHTATLRNEVILDNNSLFNATGYIETGNSYSGDAFTSFATLNFDIKDEGSVVRIQAGTSAGLFGDAANIDLAYGTMFTSSTLGNDKLTKTDIGGGYYEISVIPEPATLGLVAAFGGAILFMRRRFMI